MEFSQEQPGRLDRLEITHGRDVFARLDTLLEQFGSKKRITLGQSRSMQLEMINGATLSVERDRSLFNYLSRSAIYRICSDTPLQLSSTCTIENGETLEFGYEPESGEILGYSRALGKSECLAITLLIEEAIKSRAEAA